MESNRRDVRHYLTPSGRDVFGEWVTRLKDRVGRAHILKRIDRLEGGNFGDHRSVGEGVWELRVHIGPGYRVYYGEEGRTLVLLLCGGDNKSHSKDIRLAQSFWHEFRGDK
jgi:putative addiction module killer protein